MITNIDDALAEVQAMMEDYAADAVSDEELEVDPSDCVVSVAWNIKDNDLARELCRVQLGFVPFELEGRLGKTDWVR